MAKAFDLGGPQVLKINLLPKAITQGRRNAKVAMICGIAVLLSLGVMFLWIQQINANIGRANERLAEVTVVADEVRAIQGETATKQAELDPIQAKIDFVEDADTSGLPYFDRFWKINEYIYQNAQMTDFQITAPSSVSFTVTVNGTTEAGRFLLNLIFCPHINGIQVSGMPAGDTVQAPGDLVNQTQDQLITFSITATLDEPITTPAPAGGGGGATAGAGMGMPGGGMDPMMMEGPGAPGAGPGGPEIPPAPGGAPEADMPPEAP